MFCVKCGHEMEEGIRFCPKCGTPVGDRPQNQMRPSESADAGNVPTKKGKISGGIVAVIIAAAVIVCAGLGFGAYMLVSNVILPKAEVREEAEVKTHKKPKVVETLPETEEPEIPEEPEITEVPEINNAEEETEIPETTEINEVQEEPERFIKVYHIDASSALEPSKTKYYYAEESIDGRLDTCWSEGVKGVGKGEWLALDFDREMEVCEIHIYNGYLATPNLYWKNGIANQVTFSFEDGSSYSMTMERQFFDKTDDEPLYYEDVAVDNFRFEIPVRSRWVNIRIDNADCGTMYDDTCISEIEVYGRKISD